MIIVFDYDINCELYPNFKQTINPNKTFEYLVSISDYFQLMEDQIEISSDDEFDLDKDFDLPLGERLGLERSGVGAVTRTFTHSRQEDGNISAAKVLERNSSIAVSLCSAVLSLGFQY